MNNVVTSGVAWVKAHKVWSVVIGLVILAILGNGLSHGGSTTPKIQASATATPQATNTPMVFPTATPSVLQVGDGWTLGGYEAILVKVAPIQPGEFDSQPKSGNEYIVVTVKLINKSGSEQSYNEFDFHVRSSSGNVTDATFYLSTYSANNLLQSGHLTNNGTVTGDMIFEVPIGDHGARLTWQPGFGNNGDNDWYLGL